MIDRNAIKRQQQVLKHFGYYKGQIDGIWSKASIEAKIAFERSGKFNPGIPNSGLPFDYGVRLPKGLVFDTSGYLAIVGVELPSLMSEERIEVKPVEKAPEVKQNDVRPNQNNGNPNKHNNGNNNGNKPNQPQSTTTTTVAVTNVQVKLSDL